MGSYYVEGILLETENPKVEHIIFVFKELVISKRWQTQYVVYDSKKKGTSSAL